jgi:hypothetical protein
MAGAAECAIGAPSNPLRMRGLGADGFWVTDFIISSS